MSGTSHGLGKLRNHHSVTAASMPGLTNGGWDVEQTQRVLNAYIKSAPEERRHTDMRAPEQLVADGVFSNGRLGKDAANTTTFAILDHFVKTGLDKRQAGLYVPVAHVDPTTPAGQHELDANLMRNMQRMVGFADVTRMGLTSAELADVRAGNTAALNGKVPAQDVSKVAAQIQNGEIVDGAFGDKSKKAWNALIRDPATMTLAHTLGAGLSPTAPSLQPPSAPVASASPDAGIDAGRVATAAKLTAVLGTPVTDNRNGTFMVTVPSGITNPEQYYQKVTDLIRQDGGTDVGSGATQKIGPLHNGKKIGVGGSVFPIGEAVVNQPGVMANLESNQAAFHVLAMPDKQAPVNTAPIATNAPPPAAPPPLATPVSTAPPPAAPPSSPLAGIPYARLTDAQKAEVYHTLAANLHIGRHVQPVLGRTVGGVLAADQKALTEAAAANKSGEQLLSNVEQRINALQSAYIGQSSLGDTYEGEVVQRTLFRENGSVLADVGNIPEVKAYHDAVEPLYNSGALKKYGVEGGGTTVVAGVQPSARSLPKGPT